jgi:quinol monooxygenase YgiN
MAEMIALLAITPLLSHRIYSYNRFSTQPLEGKHIMVKLAILAQIKAKPGKEAAVEEFLKSALPLANQEAGTTVWFALKMGPATFGIFDAFANEAGRDAHLSGPIAAALMANAAELLAEPPSIEKVEVLAAKLAG